MHRLCCCSFKAYSVIFTHCLLFSISRCMVVLRPHNFRNMLKNKVHGYEENSSKGEENNKKQTMTLELMTVRGLDQWKVSKLEAGTIIFWKWCSSLKDRTCMWHADLQRYLTSQSRAMMKWIFVKIFENKFFVLPTSWAEFVWWLYLIHKIRFWILYNQRGCSNFLSNLSIKITATS